MPVMKYILLSLLLGLTLLTGCDKCNYDYNFIYSNDLTFRLFERGSNLQILGVNGRYNLEEVKIYDESGSVIFPGPIDLDGLITFYFLSDEDSHFSSDAHISKQFYLYLDSSDTDTIRVEYIKKKNECGYDVIGNVRISYNDSLYTNVICCNFSLDFYKR